MRVRRSGFGRGVNELQRVHVTANASVPATAPGQRGYYRLAWRFRANGVGALKANGAPSRPDGLTEYVTSCLPFDASAEAVQDEINAFPIDFNNDGEVSQLPVFNSCELFRSK